MECTDEIVRMVLVDRDGCGDSEWCRQCSDCLDCSKAVNKYLFGRIEELEGKTTDENMEKSGWIKGPLDADGEMWHPGDMSASEWGVIEDVSYNAYENAWYITGHDTSAPWIPADSIRHYHKPTVEDILREFGDEYCRVVEAPNPIVGFGNSIIGEEDPKDTISEYATKLRELMQDG